MKAAFAAACIMALVTYLPRVLPMALFKRKIKSVRVKSFLYYMPYAVLGAMTFPGILNATGNLYFSLAGMVTALVLAYFEKGLMTVAVGAVLMALLCDICF